MLNGPLTAVISLDLSLFTSQLTVHLKYVTLIVALPSNFTGGVNIHISLTQFAIPAGPVYYLVIFPLRPWSLPQAYFCDYFVP